MANTELMQKLAGQRKRRGRVMLTLGGVLVAVLVGVFFIVPRFSGVNFSVSFNSASTLKPGDPVIRQGIVIGEVCGVDFAENGGVRVDARLHREHRERVRSHDLFLIVNPSFPLSTGGMALEVFPGSEQAPPLQSRSVLKGCNSRVEVWLGQAGTSVQDAAAAVRQAGRALAVQVQELFNSDASGQLGERIAELKEEAERIASGYYAEHAGEVEAAKVRLRDGYEAAREAGQAKVAEKFREAAEMLESQQESK